jgi:hypothetical protein
MGSISFPFVSLTAKFLKIIWIILKTNVTVIGSSNTYLTLIVFIYLHNVYIFTNNLKLCHVNDVYIGGNILTIVIIFMR